jgi:hypothetical protein
VSEQVETNLAEALAIIEVLVDQHCTGWIASDDDPDYFNSEAITANAMALRFLEAMGRVTIEAQYGRMISARKAEGWVTG